MQVQVRRDPKEIDPAVVRQVTSDVTAALQGVATKGTRFVVNDTLWYGLNRKSKVTAQVVNSAGFISKTIQKYLQPSKKLPLTVQRRPKDENASPPPQRRRRRGS